MLDNTLLESTKIDMFKFFTADSNILIAVVSLILLIFEYKLINKKINIIPNYIYILKYIEI